MTDIGLIDELTEIALAFQPDLSGEEIMTIAILPPRRCSRQEEGFGLVRGLVAHPLLANGRIFCISPATESLQGLNA